MDYFGARYNASAVARWAAVDPLTEKHPEWTPYNYVLNNPLALVDPDGKQEWANALTMSAPIMTGVAWGSLGGPPGIAIGAAAGAVVFVAVAIFTREAPGPAPSTEQLPDAAHVAVPGKLTTSGAEDLGAGVLLLVGDDAAESAPARGPSHPDRPAESPSNPDGSRKEAGKQFEEITRAQQRARKQGEGERIRSTRKSKQRDRRELQEEAQKTLDELRKIRKPGNP